MGETATVFVGNGQPSARMDSNKNKRMPLLKLIHLRFIVPGYNKDVCKKLNAQKGENII